MKRNLLATCRKMQENGLVIGPGGNASIIDDDGIIWITPSGIPFVEMGIDDFVPIKKNTGKILNSKLMPSSELPLHLFIYRMRNNIECVIHAHPPYVIALSAANVHIRPLFPDFVIYLGGHIPQIPYMTPCTEEMGRAVAEKIKEFNSCILKNHGAVTVGKTVKEAYIRMQVLESGAEIFFKSLQIGTPDILTDKDINEILNLDIEKYRKKLLENPNK
ncbi:MAG: class II aldolase/adducin family protein [Candidatus Helarchaeota archaeon]